MASSQILSIVCKTVKSRHQRNKFKEKSGGNGVELFRWLNTEISRLIDDDAAEAIEAAITAFFSRGITAHTPSAFNAVADQIVLWNKVLTGNSRFIAEPALAGKFLDLMRKELGRTEYSELKRDVKDLGGIGSVEKTRDIIVDFLTKDITVALKDGVTATPGKVLQLRGDPNKDGQPKEESNSPAGKKRTPQEREAAGEQPPGLCPMPHSRVW